MKRMTDKKRLRIYDLLVIEAVSTLISHLIIVCHVGFHFKLNLSAERSNEFDLTHPLNSSDQTRYFSE
jgi:hypothetical protein